MKMLSSNPKADLLIESQENFASNLSPEKPIIKRLKKYRFGIFARAILRKILPKKYNIHFYYDEKSKLTEPPYFLFGNHTSFLDPFIMGMGCKDHVNYVANDEYFRFRIIGFAMKILGAIPKSKFMSDTETVREIFRHKASGDVIGVYPEGGRTWQGETQPLLFATSKLVKKLKIPVVIAVTKGESLSFPRWAKHFRKGKVDVFYKFALSSEQIETMTAEDIHAELTKILQHNEAEWNRKEKTPFNGKKLAERLEWFLYACPQCKSFETMESKDDEFVCSKCGYKVKYDKFGFFSEEQGKKAEYDNTISWNDFQFSEMQRKVKNLQDGEVLLVRKNVSFFNGKRRARKLGKIMVGTLRLTNKGYELQSKDMTLVFDYNTIVGLTVNHKNILDFYYNDDKLRLEFKSEKICGYVWEDAIKALKKINIKENENEKI
ncbi:MAG: lysophospholipid acyltransferase family protein [Clostridia bacterium]